MKKDLNERLIEVCKKRNSLQEVKALFAGPNIPDVNYLAAYAYRKACMYNLEAAQYLLTNHKISLESQKLALKVACKNGMLECYKMIVENSNILGELSLIEMRDNILSTTENSGDRGQDKLHITDNLLSHLGVAPMLINKIKPFLLDYVEAKMQKNAIEGAVGDAKKGRAVKL